MKTLQLTIGALVAAALAAGCSRDDADERALRAAAGMRDAAARAGDQLGDSWLTTKIQAQYFADNDIKARFVNVSTRDGVVVLKGRVDDENARMQAVQIARNTDGVREVHDRLIVGPPGSGPEEADGAWITTQIQARYFADSDLDENDIEVVAEEGIVTLSGTVDSESERERAVAIANDIDGVSRVENRLLVETKPVPTAGTMPSIETGTGTFDDEIVTSRIQAKYYLDTALKARRIEVSARQGVVTLRGEVASDAERAQALLLAQTTAGVARVEDSLSVNAALAPAGTPAYPGDMALTEQVRSQILADPQIAGASIEVTAKDGVVLLQGRVASEAARQRALSLARQTAGVVNVVDSLTVGR